MHATQLHLKRPATPKPLVVVKKRPSAAGTKLQPKPQPTAAEKAEKAARAAANEAKIRVEQVEAKQRRRARNEEIIAAMREQWPMLFGHGTLIRPLQKGIGQAIAAGLPQFKPRHVCSALSVFLNRPTVRAEYLFQLTEGGPRYGLDGQASDEMITEGERETAVKQLRELEQRFPWLAHTEKAEREKKGNAA